MISDEEKEQVRAATDLVALVQETVEVRPRGHDFWCCCPFHGEKTPSFHIIPATQVWHCFGCGEGGDCFSYIQKRENLSFLDSVRYLAERAGIELHEERAQGRTSTKRARLYEVCEETSQFYHLLLMRGRDGRGRAYCVERELDSATCKRYRLGFAPGHGALVAHLGAKGFTQREMIDANVAVSGSRGEPADRFFDRVMFPIFDDQGRCVAFGGRALDKEKTNAKYLNSSETAIFHKGKQLYGFNWAKGAIVARDEAIVVEGYISAMTCWKAGIENLVAVLGTALTEDHVKTLARFCKRIVYLFDGDAAGQRAARRAVQFIEQDDIDLRCVILPDGMDPDDYVRAYGGERLRALIEASEPLLDFVFRTLAGESDVSTPGGRAKALQSACEVIYPLRQSYAIETYYMQIADLLGLDVAAVRKAAGTVFREVARSEEATRRREQLREQAQRAQAAPRVEEAGGARASDAGAWHGAWELTAPGPGEPGAHVGPAEDIGPTEPADRTVPVVYSELERRQLAAERELLTLLTTFPDSFRPFGERIADIGWVDPRHESIAWSVLGCAEGSSPAEVMAVARSVCPEADRLVGAGSIEATSAHPTETNIAFLIDTLDLLTVKRRLQGELARLRGTADAMDAGERRELTIRASRDAARVRELERAVGDVADPFFVQGDADDPAS